MNSVSVSYALKYQLDFAPEYQFSGRDCFNVKRGTKIKRVVNGRCVGYCIRGKFHSLTRLKKHLQLIEKIDCPF